MTLQAICFLFEFSLSPPTISFNSWGPVISYIRKVGGEGGRCIEYKGRGTPCDKLWRGPFGYCDYFCFVSWKLNLKVLKCVFCVIHISISIPLFQRLQMNRKEHFQWLDYSYTQIPTWTRTTDWENWNRNRPNPQARSRRCHLMFTTLKFPVETAS